MPPILKKLLFISTSRILGFTQYDKKDLPKLYIQWRSTRRKFLKTLSDEEFTDEIYLALDECELLFEATCRKSVNGFESILEQSQIRKIEMESHQVKKKRFWEKGSE